MTPVSCILRSWRDTSSRTAKGILQSLLGHHPCRSQTRLGPSHPTHSPQGRSIHDAPSTTQEGVLGSGLEGPGLPEKFHIVSASVPPHGLEI